MSSVKGSEATLTLLLLVLSGCLLSSTVKTETFPAVDKYRVKTIVIMPFQELSTPQIADPLTQEFLVPGEVKRSSMSVSAPTSPDRRDRPTVTVPANAGESRAGQQSFGLLRAKRGRADANGI